MSFAVISPSSIHLLRKGCSIILTYSYKGRMDEWIVMCLYTQKTTLFTFMVVRRTLDCAPFAFFHLCWFALGTLCIWTGSPCSRCPSWLYRHLLSIYWKKFVPSFWHTAIKAKSGQINCNVTVHRRQLCLHSLFFFFSLLWLIRLLVLCCRLGCFLCVSVCDGLCICWFPASLIHYSHQTYCLQH